MAKRRGGKSYIPSITNLAYSGVEDCDLEQVKDELARMGASEVAVEPDDGDYSMFPEPGPYWIVSYKK
jgi:hypothetical protein